MRTVYSIGEALRLHEEHRLQEEHRAQRPQCKCRDCEFHRTVTIPTIAAIRAAFRDTPARTNGDV